MIVTSPCIMTNRSKTKKYIYHIYTNPTKSVTLHGKPKIVHCCYIHVLEKKKKNWKMSKQIKMYQVHYSKKKNLKIIHNGFCGVIYGCLACVPAFLGEKKNIHTLVKLLYKLRERGN